MEQNNMDSRNEQWRIDLRNSKTPKERTAIPRVEMPQLGTQRGPGRRLGPATDQTDGFFFARVERPC